MSTPRRRQSWIEMFRRGRSETRGRQSRLAQRGITARGRHGIGRVSNVATMVQNRAYMGEAFHGKHHNPSAHQAIVTLPEWEAANAVNGDRAQSRAGSALLAGIIRCAGCRYAMRRTWVTHKLANGETRKYETYSCQRKHTGGVCACPCACDGPNHRAADHWALSPVARIQVLDSSEPWSGGHRSGGTIAGGRRGTYGHVFGG